jgi:hypothetical protein
MERCYWDYLRLIVPAGAQLISGPMIVVDGQNLLRGQATTGELDIAPLAPDKTSWGQLFVLAPQDTITLEYVYTLPPETLHFVDDHWEYTLYLQKQPGTLEPGVEVVVTLPEGAQLIESQPQPTRQQGVVSTYFISLSTDQRIAVSYQLP